VYTSSGTYQAVIANAQGCDSTITINLTVHPLPIVDAGNDFSVCVGDEITLSGSGASSYTWDNGVNDGVPFTEQGTQIYTVTGTDVNNCSNTDQVTVTVNALPTIDAGIDFSVCEGDQITLSGSGAIDYTWDNSVSNGVPFTEQGTQTYSVTGTDANNCTNTDQVVVTVNEHSSATQTQSALDSYTWPVNGQTYTQSGTYAAVIPNATGCDSTITLNLSLNFTDVIENGTTHFTVHPNPTFGVLNVIMPSESSAVYTVLDSRGRKVLEGKLSGTETQIDLKALSNGAYMLKIGEEKVPVRVIKQ
jgi:phage terminase large subunit-like protein